MVKAARLGQPPLLDYEFSLEDVARRGFILHTSYSGTPLDVFLTQRENPA
jgi:hypothetical protein